MPSWYEIYFREQKIGQLFFLDGEVSGEGNKCVTAVYCSGACTHFDIFLSTTYPCGMICILTFIMI